ncbi:MAG TPA: hypothetical protein PKD55_00015 [Bellilinea sp.]|nr:hypothetical protein [Bellilinea sp.]
MFDSRKITTTLGEDGKIHHEGLPVTVIEHGDAGWLMRTQVSTATGTPIGDLTIEMGINGDLLITVVEENRTYAVTLRSVLNSIISLDRALHPRSK